MDLDRLSSVGCLYPRKRVNVPRTAPRRRRMKWALVVLVSLLATAMADPTSAAEPAVPLASRLAGHTLNVVAWVPSPPGSRNGSLTRIMLQAYLRPDGRALVREWAPARNSYTPVADRRWSLSGSTLCVDLPGGSTASLCTDVHVWGPRIAGYNTRPYAMIDGDLAPGNMIAPGR